MPNVAAARLPQLLAQRPPAACFFLHGEEHHLREEALASIVGAFLDPAIRDFNFDQLRGGEAQPETLASLIATPPMMAAYRVVVVRDVQGLSARARDVVEAAAAATPAGLVLVLSGEIPSGSKAKFYGNLQKHAVAVEFGAVDALDLPGWLVDRAADAHGLELDVDAARALATAIGNQLGVLASELDKLASYVHGRSVVTLDDVRAVGGYIPRVDRWKWFDLVVERRFDEALRLLPELLASGESGVGLVIGIGGQVTRLGLAVTGGKEGLERELKPHQRWLAGRILPAARRWSASEVLLVLRELLRTDTLLKSASLTDRQAMEELLLRIAAGVARDRRAA